VDDSVAIMALKRAAADFGKSLDEDLHVRKEHPEKVAVVGGGPAGLMAAYDLRKMGYQVTIFEAQPVLGGMLSVAIPEQRLPADVSRKDIDRILKMGIEVKLNTRVGVDIRLSELSEKYQSVFVAVGAHLGKTPGIENDGAGGVVKGIDFLKDVRLGRKIETKEKVAILGGGNVAVDCARTCLRLGFKEVTVLYRRSRAEMPALPGEIREAENEGVKFLFLVSPVKVLADDRVNGLKCLRMKLGEPDSSGRRRPLPVPGSEFDLAADLLILAVGEVPDLTLLEGEKTPLRVHDGLLAADPLTLQTDLAGVFAGGDAVSGPATVIAALAAGRKAAVSIDRFLRGQPLEPDR
jgi:NADPH-dependent glutamate synthase beta subunit-like oxidoreductase